jgi:hypothetical protein
VSHVRPDLIMNVDQWIQLAQVIEPGDTTVLQLTIDFPRFFDRVGDSDAGAIDEAISNDLVGHLGAVSSGHSVNLKLSNGDREFASFAFGSPAVELSGIEDLTHTKPEATEDTGLVFETTAWRRPSGAWGHNERHNLLLHNTILRCWAPCRKVIYQVTINQDLREGGPWRLQIRFPGGAPTTNERPLVAGEPLDPANIGNSKSYVSGMLDEHDPIGFDPLGVCSIEV